MAKMLIMQKYRTFISASMMIISIVFMVLFVSACGSKGNLYEPSSVEILDNQNKSIEIIQEVIDKQEKQVKKKIL